MSKVFTVSNAGLNTLQGSFQLICANIVHDVLVGMAPRFQDLLAPGGRIVLAGILGGEQEKSIEKIYGKLGLMLQQSKHEEEWAALLLGAR
ncbi:MAG: hypothetical protein GQ559_02625 [Desulfobulbaceae bacterium]|nr:hypothetical protein [Desulfobulbaceae bacterium]